MYSYRHSRTCLCAECVGGDSTSLDRALDASVARLSASMATPDAQPEVASLGELERANGKAPWEMSALEFVASAALRVVPVWGSDAARRGRMHEPPQRTLGLKRSYLRDGTELRLDCEWAPPGGYVILVPQDEESALGDPRRAFVKAAMDRGIAVDPEILAAYPDLTTDPPAR
jgi:hypothetical protein